MMHHLPELRSTLVEADANYNLMIDAGESPNVDRFGYASLSTLDQVRRLLNRPHLTSEELAAMMRQSLQNIATADQIDSLVPRPVQAPHPDHDWSTVMARFMMDQGNEN